MTGNGKIVIIEDNIANAARLSLELSKLGYEIKGIFSRPKEALSFIKDSTPDIVLLHQKMKGRLNGMELNGNKPAFPVIYFNKGCFPQALLNKLPTTDIAEFFPEKKRITENFKEFQKKNLVQVKKKKGLFVLKDRVFIRNRDRMVKITLNEIRFIEADRNYCKVYTTAKNYLLVSTLKEVDNKLSSPKFLRVHRSYLVNLSHVDEIASNQLLIGTRSIPVSKGLRGELLKHLQVL